MISRLSNTKFLLWLGLVVTLAVAESLEHIARSFDVFSSMKMRWVGFTLSSYLSAFIVTSGIVALIHGIVVRTLTKPSQFWSRVLTFSSASLGILVSALAFPAMSDVFRQMLVPEFTRRFSIDTLSIAVIITIFTFFWVVVYRFPWHWKIRPAKYSSPLFLIFIFIAGFSFGYFTNYRLHHTEFQSLGIYSIGGGPGEYKLAQIVHMSPGWITLAIADTVFTVRPSSNTLTNIGSYFPDNLSNHKIITINVYNFFDWDPRSLAKGSTGSQSR